MPSAFERSKHFPLHLRQSSCSPKRYESFFKMHLLQMNLLEYILYNNVVSDSGNGIERTKHRASLNSLKGRSKGQSFERLGYHNENVSPEEPTSSTGPLGAWSIHGKQEQKLLPIQKGSQAIGESRV